MAHVTGTITDGEKVLYQDISIDLQPRNSFGGPMGFQGEFDIPQGGPFVSAGRSCELECSDGRSGQILIKRVHVSSKPPNRITFVTSGPFV
jgi:hypothetical protein